MNQKNKKLNNIISIVTPSFNQAEFLGDTIKSVLSQEGDFYLDYIINDGGSSDNSVQVIKKYESLLQENCDVLELEGLKFYVLRNKDFQWNACLGISFRWSSEKDKGQPDAINKGFQSAKGDIAAFINSDDLYYPQTLKTISELNWRNFDLLYGKGMWVSKKGEDMLYFPTFKPTKYSLFYQCTICQPTVFFKRQTLNKLGAFSLKYYCVFDYEYWMRAISKNCKFKFVNKPLACSRMYGDNKSLSSQKLVADEVVELKNKYYSDSKFRLNGIRKWFNFMTVQRETERCVDRLNELLIEYQNNQIEPEPINLSYDISVLGAGSVNNLSRTGIFRVAENQLIGLANSDGLDIEGFASPQFLKPARGYINTVSNLNISEPVSGLSSQWPQPGQINIFHSPFYAIPESINQQKSINKFLTIYDLIPIKFPHFFTQASVKQFDGILSSINEQTKILCISESTKNDLCNHLDFINPENVFVTHLAASSLFHPETNQDTISTVKKKYKIPASPYLLSLSTLEPRKNIETAMQAFLQLVRQEKVPGLNLVLVGSKGWKIAPVIKQFSKNPALKGRLIFTGYVNDDDLAALYSGASAFVYPSYYEGFGLPPLEAMQCGVPVIASDNSSIPEVVGKAGILIDPHDKDALSQGMLDVINSKKLRSTLKKKSLQQAKKFSWEKHTKSTISAYRTAQVMQHDKASSSVKKNLKIGVNFTGLIPGKIGGMEKYMRALVHHIPRISETHETYVFLRPEYTNEVVEMERLKKVCVNEVPMPNEQYSEIHDLVEELGIDIWLSPLLILDPHTLNIPSLYCVPDIQHEFYPEFFSTGVLNWREKHFKKSAETADGVLTISHFSKQTIVDIYGISPEKIHVTWLDCPTYFSLEKALEHEEYVRKKFSLPKQFIFYPANTWAHKNHLTLIKALEHYEECYGDAPALVLTGYPSDIHTKVATAIEDSKLKHKVHFLGYVNKELMPAIYVNATCLVFPSMFEGFGIPLVEAMRTNCPIIAANNTTMKEIAGDAAIYFNTMNAIELAVLIKFMMTDQDLRNTLIKNGAERAKLFSFEKCVRQTLDIIDEVYMNCES